jgi:hypothetical protein
MTQGPSCFPFLCHGIAVNDGGGRRSLTRDSKKDRRNVPGGSCDGVHPK